MDEAEIYKALVDKCGPEHASIQKVLCEVGSLPQPEKKFSNALDFLARSIVGQQLSVKAARSIWGRVLILAKKKDTSISELLSLQAQTDLRGCGISQNKVRALLAVKEYFKAADNDDHYLAALGHEQRSKELKSIWGIGQWTCDMLSIFHFQEQDIWPLEDAGIQRGLKKIMGVDEIPQETFIEIGECFKPHRSALSLYIWHALDTDGVL